MHLFGEDTDAGEVERAIGAGEHFWLDVPRDRFDPQGPVARALHVDETTLARIGSGGGRPRAFVAEERAAIVFSGASLDGERVVPVSVTVLAGPPGIVTLREGVCEPLDDLKESPHDIDVLSVLDALSDSLLGVATQMESLVEDIEDRILQPGAGRLLPRVTDLRQEVARLLRMTRFQRGLVVRNEDTLGEVHVAYGDAARRVRDLTGHLAYADGLAESTRETIAEALNLYLSIAAERLTRIATVLLPLTVVTGFFGMNFEWLTEHLGSLWSFLLLGIGGPLVSVAGVRVYLQRRGYG